MICRLPIQYANGFGEKLKVCNSDHPSCKKIRIDQSTNHIVKDPKNVLNSNDSKVRITNKTTKDKCYSKFEAKTMSARTDSNSVVKRKRGRPSGASSVTRKELNCRTEPDDYKSSKKPINGNSDSLNKKDSITELNFMVTPSPTSSFV